MLSIVIPCKNEGESIFQVLTEIRDTMQKKDIPHELIVVNNNSTDNTVSEASRVGSDVLITDCEIPGYGAAIMHGVKKAKYSLICKLDGDGSYDPKDIPEFLRLHAADESLQLVIGNRFMSGNTENMSVLSRMFGVPALNLATNLLFPSKNYIDAHCGLRVFKKDMIENLGLHHLDFSFANEMVCMAIKRKLNVRQVPITLRKDFRVQNTSKIRVVKDGLDALATIIKLRIRS